MATPNFLNLPQIPPTYPTTASLPTGSALGALAIVLSPSPPTIYVYDGSAWVIANTVGSGNVTGVIGSVNQVLANGVSGSSVDGEVTVTLANGISLGTAAATAPPTGGILSPGFVIIGDTLTSASAQAYLTVDTGTTAAGTLYLKGNNVSGPLLLIQNVAANTWAFRSNGSSDTGGVNALQISNGFGSGNLFINSVSGAVRARVDSMSIGPNYYTSAGPTGGGLLVETKALIGTTTQFDANTVLQVNRTGAYTYLDISGDPNQQQAVRLSDGTTSIILYKLQSTTTFRIYNGGADVAGFHTNGSLSIGSTFAGAIGPYANGLTVQGISGFASGVTIGSTSYISAPPTDGLSVQGRTILGSTTINAVNACRTLSFMNTTDGCGLAISGTANTLLDNGKMTAVFIFPTLTPTSGIPGNVLAGMSIAPTIISPAAQTINTAQGLNISLALTSNVGTISILEMMHIYNSTGAGTITLAKGLVVEAISTGVSNICAQFGDGISIGSTYQNSNIIPPTNGAVFQGAVGIATNAVIAGNLLTLGTINTAIGECVRVNGTLANQSYISFYQNTTRSGYIGTGGASNGLVVNSDTGCLILQTAGIPTYFTGQSLVGINGGLSIGSTAYVVNPPTNGFLLQGNMALFGTASFGGGTSVIFIGNASVTPTTNPSAGGILYVDAGALKYRGSSGTTTTIAIA